MSEHVTIEKIVINIGKKKLELSAEEAKELKDVLDNLLSHKMMMDGSPIWIWYPSTYPVATSNWDFTVSNNGIASLTNTNYSKGAQIDRTQ